MGAEAALSINVVQITAATYALQLASFTFYYKLLPHYSAYLFRVLLTKNLSAGFADRGVGAGSAVIPDPAAHAA